MQYSYVYVGCFIPFDELNKKTSKLNIARLAKIILTPHITFEYKPKKVDRSLFGEEMTVTVIGYGNDGENEGLKVRIDTNNPTISHMIDMIQVAHMTLSVSETGKPVNTKDLLFVPIEPIVLLGKYGGYTCSGDVDTIPSADICIH